MQKNAAVITVIYCIVICLTFNYTFPLHREGFNEPIFPNATEEFNSPIHHDSIVQRSKTMASSIENALKRARTSTQDFGKNLYNQVNSGLKNVAALKNPTSEDDIRRYEELVLMKKYPYFDMKEYELKFRPSKSARQSKFQPETSLRSEPEPSLCEPMDESPNVEITNRGLSGFAIPPQLSKPVNLEEKNNKLFGLNVVNANEQVNANVKLLQKAQENSALGRLKNEVMEYVGQKIT